jgi:gamma-glutamyl-gamma-aminobutyraldehyde dehydrogenase
MSKTFKQWQEMAATLKIESRAFINGEFTNATNNKTFPSISPIDGRHLADVASAQSEDVERAVQAARSSFNSGVWSQISPRERKAVLLRWAQLLREHNDELALLDTIDAGKTITDTSTGDIPCVIYCLEWFAEAIDKVSGEVIQTDPSFLGMVTREPIGVVAAIVPWNYPLLMAAWKFAPALAAGNSVIIKPSEKSPLSILKAAQLAHEAGIPAGVFQVLPGAGDVGNILSLHKDIDCLAFTGSGGTGRKIMHNAADSNLKRVWLELGGKSPNIILKDCPDLQRAANAASFGIFANAGQVCSAGSRVLVHHDLKGLFLDYLQEATANFKAGNPLDPDTTMGALVDEIQLNRVLGYIERGRTEAKLIAGGSRAAPAAGGFYVEPTIFSCSNNQPAIAREEIFGPVLSVIPFDTTEEAIAIANASEYGLAAAVWSADIGTAHEMGRQLRAGTVWINCYDEIVDMNFPFGGYKQSGNGRDNSIHALEKYTELKSTILRLR